MLISPPLGYATKKLIGCTRVLQIQINVLPWLNHAISWDLCIDKIEIDVSTYLAVFAGTFFS